MSSQEIYFIDEKDKRRFKIKQIVSKTLTYAFLTFFAIIMLLPFFYMIVTSLKTPASYENEVISRTLVLFPSFKNMTFENFKHVLFGFGDTGNSFASGNFLRYFVNTIFVAVASTAITTITTVLSAFAFARLNFPGKNILFTILLSTMMIPGEMMIITNYTTVAVLGWLNTYQALIITHAVSIFYIYYLRQTFQQIPNELFLAAKVDGYGVFKYLWKVMRPIAMPTIVSIIILSVMGSWNAYMWPTLAASRAEMRLVANGLMGLFSSLENNAALNALGYNNNNTDTLRLAGSLIVTAPLFVFFLCFRKYIMRGVSRSGIKG